MASQIISIQAKQSLELNNNKVMIKFTQWLENMDVAYIRVKFSNTWLASSFAASYGLEPNVPDGMRQEYDPNEKHVFIISPQNQVKEIVQFLKQCLKKYNIKARISVS